ncbi:MAG TPA: patatin-like phospholipase family protein [Anseongella sp.]|nr:patatin-like phospholipase family protein [Anseongella sp.]
MAAKPAPIDPGKFTEHHEVVNILYDLKESRARNPDDYIFSDVVDDEGHEYVDLVQEGGGMLGIALLGYTFVLEQMGIRFYSLAGTSAGAINTMLLAAFGTPGEAKSEKVLKLVAEQDLSLFVDGDSDAKKFVNALKNWNGLFNTLFRGLQVLDNLDKDMGLNPGDYFYNWIRETLESQKILSTADLMKRVNAFPESIRVERSRRKDDLTLAKGSARVAIIAADITTETKAVFPEMADLYYKNPGEVSPAAYVRASMSVPLFFSPMVIGDIPSGKDAILRWNRKASYFGAIPEKVHLVDGGIMSNFPIDVFHQSYQVPRRPTFGVKLGLSRRHANNIANYRQLLSSAFFAASNIKDTDFIVNNPDYRNLVSQIDVGAHDWLNFNMTEAEKIDLFVRGAHCAKDFLNTFRWDYYKKLRKELILGKGAV